MEPITRENILVDFQLEAEKAKADLREVDEQVAGIRDLGKLAAKTISQAFEQKIVANYIKILKAAGKEFDDMEALAAGLQEGIRDAFDTDNPEEYMKQLTLLNGVLDDYNTKLEETATATESVFVEASDAFDGTAEEFERLVQESKKLKDSVEDTGDTFRDELSGKVLEQFNQVVKESREELEGMGVDIEDFRKRIEFGATPELLRMRAEIKKLGEEADEAREKNEEGVSSVGKVGRGLTAVFRRLKALLSTLGIIGLISALVGGLTGLFSTIREQVPGAARTFDNLRDTVTTFGDYLSRTLGPIIVKIAAALDAFIQTIDFETLAKNLQGVIIIAQNILETFLGIFGLDPSTFVNGVLRAVNFVLAVINGTVSAIGALIDQVKLFFVQTALNIVETLGAIPGAVGRPFRRAAESVRESRDSIIGDLESITGSFKTAFDEIRNIEVPPAPTQRITEQVEKDTKALAGSLDFWREVLSDLQKEFGLTDDAQLRGLILLQQEDVQSEIELLEKQAERIKDALTGLFNLEALLPDDDRKLAQNRRRNALKAAEDLVQDLTKAINDKANSDLAPELERIRTNIIQMVSGGLSFDAVTPSINEALEIARSRSDQVTESLNQVAAAADRANSKIEESNKTAALVAQKRAEDFQQVLNDVGTLTDAFLSGVQQFTEAQAAAVDRQIEKLDELIEAQQARVEKSLEIADEGNAELLETELTRLDALQVAREAAQARQERLARQQIVVAQAQAVAQGILAVIRGFSDGGIVGGIASSIALAGTIAAAIISLNSAFSSLPSFKEGIDELLWPSNEARIVEVHGRERIMTAEQNSEIGGSGTSNDRVVALYKLGRDFENMLAAATPASSAPYLYAEAPGQSGGGYDFGRLESLMEGQTTELKAVKRRLENIEVQFNITERGIYAANKRVKKKDAFRNNLRR